MHQTINQLLEHTNIIVLVCLRDNSYQCDLWLFIKKKKNYQMINQLLDHTIITVLRAVLVCLRDNSYQYNLWFCIKKVTISEFFDVLSQ